MSRIQSSVGLITGIPIEDTVNQLIEVASRPRDLLSSRLEEAQAERTAINTLSGLVLGLNLSLTTLRLPTTYSARTASSSSTSLSVSVQSGSKPAIGSYGFTPLQKASAHQFVSQSFASLDDLGSSGSLNLQVGGHVDGGARLTGINGGLGFVAGKVRITDRSGSSETVDLRAATTIDDVLATINAAENIDVTASVSGGSLVITDNTGGGGALSVSEVGAGTTAASLGLKVTASGDTLTGQDIYSIGGATRLAALNDGFGVRLDGLPDVDDLEFTLQDETTAGVDLSDAKTIDDVLDAINNDEDLAGKVTASISSDGKRLQVVDNTSGAGSFVISNGSIGSAAEDLGLTAGAVGGTITGDRVVSGLRDTLVKNLNGAQGFELASIDVTDRAGGNAEIDLSGAETLGEIVDAINAEGAVAVVASINADRTGILLTDSSGGGNLTITNGSSGTTADDLGLVVDDAVSSVDGGTLSRALVNELTDLDDLNGGAGVSLGDFRITDSSGKSFTVSLDTTGSEAETLGDVIDKINTAATTQSAGVTASLNATGDGILLTDTAAGDETLTVAEVNGGSTAQDLRLLGASTGTDDDDNQMINGTTRFSIDLADLESSAESIALSSLRFGAGVTLGSFNVTTQSGENFVVRLDEEGAEAFTVGDVIDKINEESGGLVTASVNNAGTGILLTDNTSGNGELTVEDLGSGTAAAELNLVRTISDNQSGSIDGAGLFNFDEDEGALRALADRINDFKAGFTASIYQDGNGFRLGIASDATGAESELLISGADAGLTLTETSRPRDAVGLIGGGGIAVSSSTNEFDSIVDGLDVVVNEADGEEATISVANDTSKLVKAIQGLVDAYNAVVGNLDAAADFDEESLSTGILFGRSEVVRVESDLARIITGVFNTPSSFNTLASIGLTVDEEGRLELNTTRLNEALADDPEGVRDLLTTESTGVVAKFDEVIEQLARDENSLLSLREETLQRQIDTFDQRISEWDERLERQRERLLLDFFRLEETISLLQTNLSAIESITNFSFVQSSSSSSN